MIGIHFPAPPETAVFLFDKEAASMMLKIGIGLFVGFLVLMCYACTVAASDADRRDAEWLKTHPPDGGEKNEGKR